jgi:hypothetical protein
MSAATPATEGKIIGHGEPILTVAERKEAFSFAHRVWTEATQNPKRAFVAEVAAMLLAAILLEAYAKTQEAGETDPALRALQVAEFIRVRGDTMIAQHLTREAFRGNCNGAGNA